MPQVVAKISVTYQIGTEIWDTVKANVRRVAARWGPNAEFIDTSWNEMFSYEIMVRDMGTIIFQMRIIPLPCEFSNLNVRSNETELRRLS